MTAKTAHKSPSEWLGITDEFEAAEIDFACALKMERYRNEREKNFLKILHQSIAMGANIGFNGGELPQLFND